ncbi:MAG: cytochrome P450 [Chloroflexi bacterium]|nr:cytochrome P450 [Ardenticatenaceae bacterium]MBL1128588.1 cytochrome P450 [Chloroflexota bacterium]NOG34667.1 cytochrome P450 [Chloroflexota bacterium]GIK57727.1 MAG: cytochrome P450 hydroxylase [Chloroflexota bacterium]
MTFDLFSPAFKRDPFSTFARMRQEAPIYAHVSPGGATTWYITRHEDVLAVLKDNDHFVKDVRNTKENKPVISVRPTLHQLINQNMLFADPPDHTRLRALVSQAFTPRRVEQAAPRIQAAADELLDRAAAAGMMELIADYALPLPLVVISEMLGIPAGDQADVADWSQAIISPGGRGLGQRLRKQKMRALVAYLERMFANRRRQPQDDLVTALVQARMAAGDRLSQAELSSMVALLLVTGHETTVNLIGNGALALLLHPAQLVWLRANGGEWATAVWHTAVEELLRYDGPVETSTTRWVRADFTFKGHPMRRGDVVRVSLASANRDPAQFTDPDELDLARADNKHLAFGHGIHYCLGAPLARLEGQIGLQTLFTRFPNLQLAVPPDELVWRPGVLFRGLERLPVTGL